MSTTSASTNDTTVLPLTLKAVNKVGTKVLDTLTDGLVNPYTNPDCAEHQYYRKVENNPSYMPVHVECVGSIEVAGVQCLQFAVSHTGTQNGDVMFDPEMIFFRYPDGNYYPINYRNDFMHFDQWAIQVKDGTMVGVRPKMQRDQAGFAGLWMQNIKAQQRL